VGRPQPLAVDNPPQVRSDVAGRHTGRGERCGDARKQLLDRLLASGKQGMGVERLWRGPPDTVHTEQTVAVHDNDLAVGVGERLASEHPGDTAPQDECPVTDKDARRTHRNPSGKVIGAYTGVFP
jgi:hypothetical protein